MGSTKEPYPLPLVFFFNKLEERFTGRAFGIPVEYVNTRSAPRHVHGLRQVDPFVGTRFAYEAAVFGTEAQLTNRAEPLFQERLVTARDYPDSVPFLLRELLDTPGGFVGGRGLLRIVDDAG